MISSSVNKIEETQEESNVDFKKILNKYLSNWPFFIISIFLCLSVAFIYLRYTTPQYKISARLLINDDEKGGSASASSAVLGDLSGLLGAKSTVDNEVEVLKTRRLMQQVVENLNLNINYFTRGNVKDVEVYDPPFVVRIIKPITSINGNYSNIFLFNDNKLSIQTEEIDTVIGFNKPVFIPNVGHILIEKKLDVPIAKGNYSFIITSIDEKVTELMASLDVAVTNKLVTIIDLSVNNSMPKRGEDILNQLIFNYVSGNMRDKNEVADSTIAFIKRRLLIISSELGNAEEGIQSFKQRNNLADMTEQGKLLVNTTGQIVVDLAKIETQISIVNSLISYLKDDSTNKRVLPSSLASTDIVFSSAIEKYNNLLLERGRKLIGLTESNPIILNLDREISNARTDIESNLMSTLNGFMITKSKLNKQLEQADQKIENVPATERNYLKLARQQNIKEELFLFLMQKSEETAISKTANIANSKIIDSPRADLLPYAPIKSKVVVLAFIVGLLLPIIVLYVKDFFNTRVESREDILNRTVVPILGEISHNPDVNNLAVANSSRSQISEQFRALRTNLSFYLNNDEQKIILITSSVSGEGKSFVAINLGNILALSGKSVLLMELDLRKPGLSSKLGVKNEIGFTNYIISESVSFNDIIKPSNIHENLHLISSGPLPPNPAELIMSAATQNLLNELKSQFDYIIIDAPPIGIVTDAQLLAPYADVSLYLVRHRYTNKEHIKIVQDLHQSKKMGLIGIVINDLEFTNSYGYGYGYSYGSYGHDIKKESFWRKFPFRNDNKS